MKKVLFAFSVDNVVDIITNSSSELFVLEGETRDIVEEMIKEVYPNYLSEYDELKSTQDLTRDELDTYISYKYSTWGSWFGGDRDRDKNKDRGADLKTICGVEPKDLYENWRNRNKGNWWSARLSESGADKLKEAMDPDNKMWFLFSIDDNPNWEMQEELMCLGSRFHLG